MNVSTHFSWKTILKEYFKTDKFKQLDDFVSAEYKIKTIYPPEKDIFNAFSSTPFDKVKVVILGQDPYHNPEQAMGLCFSVPDGITIPPSLRNIYKEIGSDLGIDTSQRNGNLTHWTNQGVLLLNSVLTVRENSPGSHAKKGWEEFTDYVIQKVSDKHEHIVFILWGNYAKAKGKNIDRDRHLVLEGHHPSPLSAYRGFFGCKHFSQINTYLKNRGKAEIIW
jgi:uracil-DNA glycosylase